MSLKEKKAVGGDGGVIVVMDFMSKYWEITCIHVICMYDNKMYLYFSF